MMADLKDKLTPHQISTSSSLLDNFTSCLGICEASCKLLLFNVEDILALPRLKEGRFTKNIQAVDADGAVLEVMKIQEY